MLEELDLAEISVVTNPMNDAARVDAVKNNIENLVKNGELPTLSQFELFLRDVGFSRTHAKTIAGNGLRCLLNQCDADFSKVETALKGFKLPEIKSI